MSDNKFLNITLDVLKKIGTWFKSRWVGFFLLIPVALINFIFAFVYRAGFFNTDYESVTVFVLPFITLVAFVPAFFRPTARYAPILMFAIQLVTFGMFIWTGYMYLSSAFFSGIDGNVLVQAGFPFSFCTISIVLSMIITVVAMCFRQYKDEKSTFFGTPAYAMKNGEEVVSE